jgi:hypothetical protein
MCGLEVISCGANVLANHGQIMEAVDQKIV